MNTVLTLFGSACCFLFFQVHSYRLQCTMNDKNGRTLILEEGEEMNGFLCYNGRLKEITIPLSRNCTRGDSIIRDGDTFGSLKCLNGTLVSSALNCAIAGAFNIPNGSTFGNYICHNGKFIASSSNCMLEGTSIPNGATFDNFQCVNGTLTPLSRCSEGEVVNRGGSNPIAERCTKGKWIPISKNECIRDKTVVLNGESWEGLRCINGTLVEQTADCIYMDRAVPNGAIYKQSVCSNGSFIPLPRNCTIQGVTVPSGVIYGNLRCLNGTLVALPKHCVVENGMIIPDGVLFESFQCVDGNLVPIPQSCVVGDTTIPHEQTIGTMRCMNGTLVNISPNCLDTNLNNRDGNSKIPLDCGNGLISPQIVEHCEYDGIRIPNGLSVGNRRCVNGVLQTIDSLNLTPIF